MGQPVLIEILKPDGSTESSFELTGLDLPEPDVEIGGEQRLKKTTYPKGNSARPRTTFQVLGAVEDDVTLKGVWKDWRQGEGHAAEMTERFDTIRYNGKPVRLTYDNVSLEGFIAKFSVTYRARLAVGWQLEMSVGESAFAKITTAVRIDATVEVDGLLDEGLGFLEGLDALVNTIEGGLAAIGGGLQAFVDMVAAVAEVVGQVLDAVEAVIVMVKGVISLASAAIGIVNKIRNQIAKILLQIATIRTQFANAFTSAWQAATTNPVAVLEGVNLSREVMRLTAQARMRLQIAALLLDEIVTTGSPQVHAVGADDTVMSIARHYYGDSLAWRKIATANHLKGLDLTGFKTLVIP